MKESIMTARTLTSAILAITLAVPAAAAIAAQPFGRDSVYSAREASTGTVDRSSVVRNEAQPNGRDTVSASRIPGSGQSPASTAEFVDRPGRA
jgi:hypothetical protein